MNNIEQMKLTRHGKVSITKDGISLEGFSSSNASCRETGIMACAWAIGELQREMLKSIETPGAGNICLD
ncbi:hypothetical protein ACIGCM_03755 [Pseudomonas sp. NPDC078700]|uniref:hypothetical protein n=1 Tax=Pseudomonas sp. NPDC078700 TaxID=3364424 RepID=UPI0037C8203C